MYKLTTKIQALLKKDTSLRNKVALGMGIGENGVIMSLRRNKGNSIANNVGAVKVLQTETGLDESQIIKLEKATA